MATALGMRGRGAYRQGQLPEQSIKLVEEAQKTKSKTQHLADRAAKWLTYIALIAGFATLAAWMMLGKEFVFALERMVTVMAISCPHAQLAIPLVWPSPRRTAQNGLRSGQPTAFENSRKYHRRSVLDKTGTLTTGEFGVTRIAPISGGMDEKELLRFAAALSRNSEHPIAVGIMERAKKDGINIPTVEKFEAITGKGVQATVEGCEVAVVSPGYLKEKRIAFTG
ncbi:MAG: HAD family hydrolase [Flavobacteriales bacterium]